MTKDFKTFCDLKAQSGFGWDEQKQVITAEPDVWDAYIKNRPGNEPSKPSRRVARSRFGGPN